MNIKNENNNALESIEKTEDSDNLENTTDTDNITENLIENQKLMKKKLMNLLMKLAPKKFKKH